MASVRQWMRSVGNGGGVGCSKPNPPMKTNVGSFDGAARFVAGIVVLHFGIRDIGWWGLLGLIPITTTILNWCPVYSLLHIDTRGADEKPATAEPPVRTRVAHPAGTRRLRSQH